ncbi:MAG: hypothetical protein ACKOB6_09150 [Candidatus Kapaibacterium sp.]
MTDATICPEPITLTVRDEGRSGLETLRSSGGIVGQQSDPAKTPVPACTFGIVTLQSARDAIRATVLSRRIKSENPQNTVIWYAPAAYARVLENNPHIDELVILE